MDNYVIVRTYPHGYEKTTQDINTYLENGYKIVRVDSTTNRHKETCNDYLLCKKF